MRVFVDPGHSGATLDRPDLQDMLTVLDDADIVVVDKLDRLSRSLSDTLYLVKKIFEPHNVALVSRAESFDTGSSFGRAALGILGVFGELERERIKERTHDGMVGRAKAGYWHGNAPTGYIKANDTLVFDELEMSRVIEAKDLCLHDGLSMLDIVKHFDQKGYLFKGHKMTVTTLRRILANRAYAGFVLFSGEWYPGLHPAAWTLEEHYALISLLHERSRRNERFRPDVKYAAPLGGLLWCGQCGAKYHYRLANSTGKGANGQKNHYKYSYYSCYSRSKCNAALIRDPNCKNPHYKSDVLDQAVFNEIRALKSDPSYISSLRRSVDTSKKQQAIAQRIDQLTNQISKLMDLYTVGSIPIDLIGSRMEPLNAEKNALTNELAELQAASGTMSSAEIISLVNDFEATLSNGESHAIHAAIKALVDYIMVDGETIKIHWKF